MALQVPRGLVQPYFNDPFPSLGSMILSGPAGGELAGSFPNPNFLNATTIPAVGAGIRFGLGSVAAEIQAMAFGENSSATGIRSVAIGRGASASGSRAVALGRGAFATADDAVALVGQASGVSATASGFASIASGTQAVAYGTDAQASGNQSTALGPSTRATAFGTTVAGFGATANDQRQTVIGNGAICNVGAPQGSLALGDGAQVSAGANAGFSIGVPAAAVVFPSADVAADTYIFITVNGTQYRLLARRV